MFETVAELLAFLSDLPKDAKLITYDPEFDHCYDGVSPSYNEDSNEVVF